MPSYLLVDTAIFTLHKLDHALELADFLMIESISFKFEPFAADYRITCKPEHRVLVFRKLKEMGVELEPCDYCNGRSSSW